LEEYEEKEKKSPWIDQVKAVLEDMRKSTPQEKYSSQKRCQERARLIKEDLIAAVWHPRRVEKMLDEGGFELIDSY
jgi:hypothetical protein